MNGHLKFMTWSYENICFSKLCTCLTEFRPGHGVPLKGSCGTVPYCTALHSQARVKPRAAPTGSA